MKKLIDPVAGNADQNAEDVEAVEATMNDFDFHQIPESAARQTHPFDGYPLKKVQIGTYSDKGQEKPLMVYLSSLIALAPSQYVHQDPSGKNVSHIDPQTKEETYIDYATFHNRVVRDSSGRSIDVVFDRTITFDNGKSFTRAAIVDDPTARAQIAFKVEPKTGKVLVDRRYGVFDTGQLKRLRETFNRFHYQQTASERLATKFYEEPESRAEG